MISKFEFKTVLSILKEKKFIFAVCITLLITIIWGNLFSDNNEIKNTYRIIYQTFSYEYFGLIIFPVFIYIKKIVIYNMERTNIVSRIEKNIDVIKLINKITIILDVIVYAIILLGMSTVLIVYNKNINIIEEPSFRLIPNMKTTYLVASIINFFKAFLMCITLQNIELLSKYIIRNKFFSILIEICIIIFLMNSVYIDIEGIGKALLPCYHTFANNIYSSAISSVGYSIVYYLVINLIIKLIIKFKIKKIDFLEEV
ncbi:MAG: hypothetical protein RR594_04975 [Clostridia bacterium]